MMLQETFDSFLKTDAKDVALPAPRFNTRPSPSDSTTTNRVLPHLARSVGSNLRFGYLDPRLRRNKKAMLKAYIDDCDRINEAAAQMRDFLRSAVFTSLVYGGPEQEWKQGIENTLINASELLCEPFEGPLSPQLMHTNARLVANHNPEQLYQTLVRSLDDCCVSFAQQIFQIFEVGADNFLIGRMETNRGREEEDSNAALAVQYTYYTRKITSNYRYTKERKDAHAAIETAMHLHDLVNPKLVDLPAHRVPKPDWIPPVFDSIPRFIRQIDKAALVLTGDITLERVSVRKPVVEYRVNQYPMHCDPAILMFGHWVLTGWSPDDIQNGSKLRKWTPDRLEPSKPWHETSPTVQYRRKALGRPSAPRLENAWLAGR